MINVDPVEFGKAMGAIVREATAPLIERIEQLEKKMSERLDIKAITDEILKLLPAPRDEKAVDMEAVKAQVADYLNAIPAPKDGLPGNDGKSISVDEVLPALRDQVDDFLKAIPLPKDGDPGKDAIAPTAEEIAAIFERRFSDLQLTWERQAREMAEKAIDKMPSPKNGVDALPLESFDALLTDDGRTLCLTLSNGEKSLEKNIKLQTIIDRGIFNKESAENYTAGDAVSYGGSLWIAQKDSPEGVPGSSVEWRLAVKKGRDGRDLRENASRLDPAKGVTIK